MSTRNQTNQFQENLAAYPSRNQWCFLFVRVFFFGQILFIISPDWDQSSRPKMDLVSDRIYDFLFNHQAELYVFFSHFGQHDYYVWSLFCARIFFFCRKTLCCYLVREHCSLFGRLIPKDWIIINKSHHTCFACAEFNIAIYVCWWIKNSRKSPIMHWKSFRNLRIVKKCSKAYENSKMDRPTTNTEF